MAISRPAQHAGLNAISFSILGVLFLANAYGVPLDFSQQLGILGLMLLTSKGAATVTGGSFVVFAATVAATQS